VVSSWGKGFSEREPPGGLSHLEEESLVEGGWVEGVGAEEGAEEWGMGV